MKKLITLASAAAAASLLATVPAAAHHSFAMFDTSISTYVEGTVTDWAFNNPHSWLFINVEGEDGEVALWGFEGSAPVSLVRRGITGSTFEPGDTVRVVMCPLRDDRNGGHMAFVQLEDGSIVLPNDGGCPGPAIRDQWVDNDYLENASIGDTYPLEEEAIRGTERASGTGR